MADDIGNLISGLFGILTLKQWIISAIIVFALWKLTHKKETYALLPPAMTGNKTCRERMASWYYADTYKKNPSIANTRWTNVTASSACGAKAVKADVRQWATTIEKGQTKPNWEQHIQPGARY